MKKDDQGAMLLMGGISSDQVARLQRRIRYLEAALLQVLRGESRLREWFSASDLVSFRLPGLPATQSGMSRHARDNRWESRIITGIRGETRQYHFASLPNRAFDAMLERVLRCPVPDEALGEMVPTMPDRQTAARGKRGCSATPQWLLPLMRILRTEPIPIGSAVLMLPADTWTGRRPEVGEVVAELRVMGLMA